MPPVEHPRQLAARLKLAQAQFELTQARQQLQLGRSGLGKAPLRKKPILLLAVFLDLLAVKGFERTTRTYESMAAKPPRSALLFERARQERVAALESSERAEFHRRLAGAALSAQPGRPWTAFVAQFVFGWAILGAALAVNYAIFAAFDANYFRWYLDNGALISIVFGFVSLAVRLDDYRDLISSNSMRYLYACLTLSLHLSLAWNQIVGVDPERSPGLLLAKVFDLVVSLFAWLAVAVGFVGWLLVVAPIQHLVYAVLGAPARNALRNQASSASFDAAQDATGGFADNGTSGHPIGYVEKPVTLTSALAAAVLWALSQLIA
jgi:hypothetical protein